MTFLALLVAATGCVPAMVFDDILPTDETSPSTNVAAPTNEAPDGTQDSDDAGRGRDTSTEEGSDGESPTPGEPRDGLADDGTLNTALIAHAGSDRSARIGETVVLDASLSSDGDGSALSYRWEQLSGHPVVELRGAQSIRADFIAPDVTRTVELEFELTVSDGRLSASDVVTIEIRPTQRPRRRGWG